MNQDEKITDYQLAIIMQYLWENGVKKQRIKDVADAWYKVKQIKFKGQENESANRNV